MRLVAVLLVTLLAGCVAVTKRYYVPRDVAMIESGTVCGSVPWGRARIPIASNIFASVDVVPRNGHIDLTMQLTLPLGTNVRFVDPTMRLEIPTSGKRYVAPLGPFQLSVYGGAGTPGHHEHFDPAAVLEGRGRNAALATLDTPYLKTDLFISDASVIAEPSDALVLTFPAVEVNGRGVDAQKIPLRLVAQLGYKTCVQ